jgi:putative component of membrane protein insertase Oxa1/YidC/SpoIIIJ protein YidD
LTKATLLLLLCLATVCLAGYDALSVSGEWLIGGYRAVLSPLQGQNVCNFWPTCSRFTSAAIKSQGFVPGLLIGADRLMRCNSIAWSYFDTYYYGGVINGRMSDPVENHVAWLRPADVPGLLVTAQAEGLGTRSETSDIWLQQPLSDSTVMSRGVPHPSLSFADYLYSSGEYRQAAGEYLRVRFASSSPDLSSFAGLMAAESYLRAGEPAQARRAFQAMSSESVQDFRRYGIGRTRFAEADYLGSRVILDSIGSGALSSQSRALSGWGLFRQHRFAEGASVLGTVATGEPARRLSAMDGNGIPRRSRLLSSLLSAVIPGAGHAYAGRAGDGAYSFLSVAGTGLVAWWFADDPATRDRTRVKVSIFGVLAALFYAGNVYGANVAARDYNLLQERRYVQRADSLFRLLSLEPDYRVLLDTVPADTTTPGHE